MTDLNSKTAGLFEFKSAGCTTHPRGQNGLLSAHEISLVVYVFGLRDVLEDLRANSEFGVGVVNVVIPSPTGCFFQGLPLTFSFAPSISSPPLPEYEEVARRYHTREDGGFCSSCGHHSPRLWRVNLTGPHQWQCTSCAHKGLLRECSLGPSTTTAISQNEDDPTS